MFNKETEEKLCNSLNIITEDNIYNTENFYDIYVKYLDFENKYMFLLSRSVDISNYNEMNEYKDKNIALINFIEYYLNIELELNFISNNLYFLNETNNNIFIKSLKNNKFFTIKRILDTYTEFNLKTFETTQLNIELLKDDKKNQNLYIIYDTDELTIFKYFNFNLLKINQFINNINKNNYIQIEEFKKLNEVVLLLYKINLYKSIINKLTFIKNIDFQEIMKILENSNFYNNYKLNKIEKVIEVIEENKEEVIQEVIEENKEEVILEVIEENKEDVIEENKEEVIEENKEEVIEENKEDVIEENREEVKEENKEEVKKTDNQIIYEEIYNEINNSLRTNIENEEYIKNNKQYINFFILEKLNKIFSTKNNINNEKIKLIKLLINIFLENFNYNFIDNEKLKFNISNIVSMKFKFILLT